jgi:ATP-binding cassette subfamily F protein 3
VLVQLNGVSKAFGAQTVLQNVTFQIYPAEKIGLIGTNGSGKTTLLKILSSRQEPDSGEISRKNGLRVGTLDQIPDFHEATTVFDEGLRAFAHLIAAENEMRQLEHDISETHRQDLMDRYSSLQHEFELHGGYRFRAMTEAALRGVGFSKEALGRAANTLSGGEKNRLALAKLLLSEADLLLLDEPTNHLDIRSIEWLERFLKETPKAVVVVSHDRIFLDRVASRIIEVFETRTYDYPGNYTAYLRLREERQARQEKEWRQQQEWIAEQEEYVRRNIAGQKTKQAQSRRNMLARVQRIEKPRGATSQVKFRFLPVERGSRTVLATRNLCVGYDEPLIRDLHLHVERGSRWAILGGNGTGKTTLLKTLTGSLAPLSGELDWSEGTGLGYYDQQLADLNLDATILDEIRSLDTTATDGELRSWMAQFLFSGEDIFKKVGTLSGGEKSRVALAKLIYESPTVLALDEPTNHLDIASREALESALADYPGTIIFVTHDRYLAQKIATHLVYIEDGAAHMFDRLSAFESWLDGKGEEDVRDEPPKPEPAKTESRPKPAAPVMSKNRRDKLENEIASKESQIEALEKELAALESSFSNPSPQLDWEAAHRRHAEIRQTLDTLYGRLEELSAKLLP